VAHHYDDDGRAGHHEGPLGYCEALVATENGQQWRHHHGHRMQLSRTFWLLSAACQLEDWQDVWTSLALKWLAALALVWMLQIISKSDVRIEIFYLAHWNIIGTLTGLTIGIIVALFTCWNCWFWECENACESYQTEEY